MRNVTTIIIALLLLATSAPLSFSAASYIWWEGENPTETNFPKTTWFNTGAIQGKKHLLSEGNWLSNEGNRQGDAAFARYEIEIPEAGDYEFWARKFWKHGPFEWRIGQGDWHTVSRDIALADSVSIVTHVSANWVSLGNISLPPGKTTFELRLLAKQGESLTACFDCFLLTPFPFIPRGKLKPDEKSGLADPGFFPWEPDMDTFSKEALLDLRYLNEPVAGEQGFVRHEGDHFVLGDGTPVRFWALNASSSIAALSRRSIDYMARKLAKLGVNMIRYHSPLFENSDPMKVNAKKLDDLFYLIHALKQNGIYTTVSFYFPLWFSIQPHYGIPGYDTINNKKPFALLYFNARMQEIYQSWAKALLTTRNPYTGVSLSHEPAVAMVEIINEDSFFFWTFTKKNIPAIHWRTLEKEFGKWLINRYGSLDQAFARWNHHKEPGDNAPQGTVALYEAWHMTGDAIRQANASKKKRVGDQVRFLTEWQRRFYQDIKTYFTRDLGYQGLVNAGNWHVSDANMLDALERYTYMAGDVIDKHGYFGGSHTSSDGSHSYAVREGHTFKNLAATTVPTRLPLQFIQMEDYPHIISEIGWTNPDLYRADYAFLASVYGSLQGVDGFYTFALGGAFWDTTMNKFAASCPVILGNFPAYALLYRRGDLQEAKPVIHQIVDLEDLYAMKGSGGSEAQALDDLRLKDVPPGSSVIGEVSNIDPLSFYTGKVIRAFGANTGDSKEVNLSKYIDRTNKVIQSQTGELEWHYGKGYVLMRSPTCYGVCGFTNQEPSFDLRTVRIASGNEYGSIALVALDNKPIEQSRQILIQAMTTERPYGFRASSGKEGTIKNLGGFPFGVEKIKATLSIQLDGSTAARLIPLDENGYAKGDTIVVQQNSQDGFYTFPLQEDSVYHILERDSTAQVPDWPLQENKAK